ncbi:MAG: hypothetical protein M0P17_11975 [Methanoculleus sp.]|nr:hypothetical protein [Methanoculleus sp.]
MTCADDAKRKEVYGAIIQGGTLSTAQIAKRCSISVRSAGTILSHLQRDGLVEMGKPSTLWTVKGDCHDADRMGRDGGKGVP